MTEIEQLRQEVKELRERLDRYEKPSFSTQEMESNFAALHAHIRNTFPEIKYEWPPGTVTYNDPKT